MKINLNLIKFHYFKYNNKIHNLCPRNYLNYFENLLFKWDQSFLWCLKIFNDIDNVNELKNKLLHLHEIGNDEKLMLEKVIEKCHPNLKNALDQKFEDEPPKYYQCKLNKKERLIFIIKIDLDKKLFVFPILFDLNHCFYISDKKSYDNKTKNDFKWDLKENQEKYKDRLKRNLK